MAFTLRARPGPTGTVPSVTDTIAVTGGARASGLATRTADGRLLDTWFLRPELVAAPDGAGGRSCSTRPPRPPRRWAPTPSAPLGPDAIRAVEVVAVTTTIADLDRAARGPARRLPPPAPALAPPRAAEHDQPRGPVRAAGQRRLDPARARSPPTSSTPPASGPAPRAQPLLVHSLDKFPRMVDYVVPSGVRIANADRVRLGAHLAEGTVVMHEGFVNFNAGTLGTSMVEGRIVQGVVVGDGSDIGGGASIMGTLSGGGTAVVRIGERCLIGANGGVGISLGDDSVVEAGLYVTAGTRVTLPDGPRDQGARAQRPARAALPAQQRDRRRRGARPRGARHRAQRRPPRQLGARRSARPQTEARRSATSSMRSSGWTTATRTNPAPAGP